MDQVIPVFVGLVGLILSYVVWKSSVRVARAEYHQSMQDTWNDYDQEVLARDENLRIAEWLFSTNAKPPGGDPQRRQYLAFLALNAIHSAFLGKRDGVMDPAYADANLKQVLPPLVLKDEVFRLTQECGYHPEFSRYCAELRDHLQSGDAPAGFTHRRAGRGRWLTWGW